jgi:hypothetical protein
MEKVLYIFAVPVVCVVVYLLVRFASAAFFKSKSEHERQNDHGKK